MFDRIREIVVYLSLALFLAVAAYEFGYIRGTEKKDLDDETAMRMIRDRLTVVERVVFKK